MKILVTGGAGFIGSSLVNTLIDMGIKVAVLDNLSTGKRERLSILVSFYHGDIKDLEFVSKVITFEQPDVIFHLAAQVSVQKSLTDPVEDALTNTVGTLNIIESAVKNQTRKIIFASSAAVYGTPQYLPIDEEHPAEVLSGYAISKYAAEHYLSLYQKLFSLDYTILRLANVYGPGQTANSEAGVVAIFTQNLLEGKISKIFGDGEQTRDFIYVKDVVAANLAAMNLGTGKLLNISTGKPTSINTLYKLLQDITERSIITEYLPARPGDIHNSLLSNNLANQILNWQPIYSLEEGLKETVGNWYKIT